MMMKARVITRGGAAWMAGLFLIGGLSTAAFAAEQKEEPQVTVSGEGHASVMPDQALLQLSVTRTAETAAAALTANSAAMKDVLQALKADGIAERDLQTSEFSIFPQYNQPDVRNNKPVAAAIIGYQVSNGVSVKVRDLAKLGGLIDRTVKLGVNQGGQVLFTNEDPKAAVADARRKAVQDAMEKARTLAEAAGLRLGPVVSIEEGGPRALPAPAPMRLAMAKEAADTVPIAAGENTYTVTVGMTFRLAQP
jgi:uncharacterized protein YggE